MKGFHTKKWIVSSHWVWHKRNPSCYYVFCTLSSKNLKSMLFKRILHWGNVLIGFLFCPHYNACQFKWFVRIKVCSTNCLNTREKSSWQQFHPLWEFSTFKVLISKTSYLILSMLQIFSRMKGGWVSQCNFPLYHFC